jgi:hypothetical protein
MTQIYLIQQTGETRITFGVDPDAEVACSKLQESFPGRLELLCVVRCRNVKAATRVYRLLSDRYRGHQEGDWYTLPAVELMALRFWFRVLANAVSPASSRMAHYLPDLPKKAPPRSQFFKAVEWLVKNDPDCTLPCRTVANRAGVSSGTAHNAARYLLFLRETE